MTFLICRTVIELIENIVDLEIFAAAMAKYNNNPAAYFLDEVEKALGLSAYYHIFVK